MKKTGENKFTTIYDPGFLLEKNGSTWQVKHKLLGTYEFTLDGRLAKTTDSQGNYVKLSYGPTEKNTKGAEILTLESSAKEKIEILQLVSGRPLYVIDKGGPIVNFGNAPGLPSNTPTVDLRSFFFHFSKKSGGIDYIGLRPLDPDNEKPEGSIFQITYDSYARMTVFTSLANVVQLNRYDEDSAAEHKVLISAANLSTKETSNLAYLYGKNQLAIYDASQEDFLLVRTYGVKNQQYVPLEEKTEEILDRSPENNRKSLVRTLTYNYDAQGLLKNITETSNNFSSTEGNFLRSYFIPLSAEKKPQVSLTRNNLAKNVQFWIPPIKFPKIPIPPTPNDDPAEPQPTENLYRFNKEGFGECYTRYNCYEGVKAFYPKFSSDSSSVTSDYLNPELFASSIQWKLVVEKMPYLYNTAQPASVALQICYKNIHLSYWSAKIPVPCPPPKDDGQYNASLWETPISIELGYDKTTHKARVPINDFFAYKYKEGSSTYGKFGHQVPMTPFPEPPMTHTIKALPPFPTIVQGVQYHVCAEQDNPTVPVPCRWKEASYQDLGIVDPRAVSNGSDPRVNADPIDLCDTNKTAIFMFGGFLDEEIGQIVKAAQFSIEDFCHKLGFIEYRRPDENISSAYNAHKAQGKKIVFIAHSWGAHTAIKLSKDYRPDLIITIDPVVNALTEKEIVNLKATSPIAVIKDALNISSNGVVAIFQGLLQGVRSILSVTLSILGIDLLDKIGGMERPDYNLAWYSVRATINGSSGDSNPFRIDPSNARLRFCLKDNIDNIKKALPYQAPSLFNQKPFIDIDDIGEGITHLGEVLGDVGKDFGNSVKGIAEQVVDRYHDIKKNTDKEFENLHKTIKNLAEGLLTITCVDIPVPIPINILDFKDGSQLWDHSDWIGFLGGKYYQFPKDFATKYITCEVHHYDFATMLAAAWRAAAANLYVKNKYNEYGGALISNAFSTKNCH